MQKLFGIGVSGLVGSRIVTLLKDTYLIEDLSLDTGVDITVAQSLQLLREDTEHPTVLHFAAKTNVDACEEDRAKGQAGAAYQINVLGTQNVVAACKAAGKKIIYISTDFVFDGENPPFDGYTEEDTPRPINWYAETKYKGEEIVRNAGLPYVIVRLGYPFKRENLTPRKDFVHAMLARLQNNLPLAGVTDQMITPTYIDDIAFALQKLLETEARGIYHVVGSESLSPYEIAVKLAEKFGFATTNINRTTSEEFNKGKAPRPKRLILSNDKIEQLGVRMRTFSQGLDEVTV